METNLGLNKIANYEVKIYAETANEIFQRCFLKAEINSKRNRYNMLAAALNVTFSDNHLNADFLRNTYNKIQKLREQSVFRPEITFYHINILVLTRFAEIDDYVVFNKNFNDFSIPVVYAAKPFKLFNIMRISDPGNIRQIDNNWGFTGAEGLTITGKLKSVETYAMAGDKGPLWVKICYQNGLSDEYAYFAEPIESGLLAQSSSGKLFSFLNKFLNNI